MDKYEKGIVGIVAVIVIFSITFAVLVISGLWTFYSFPFYNFPAMMVIFIPILTNARKRRLEMRKEEELKKRYSRAH